MMKSFCVTVLIALTTCLSFSSAGAAASPPSAGAVVTLTEGTVRVYSQGSAKGQLLKKGDVVRKDQEIQVSEKSKVELKFPDGSLLRLSERTRLRMNDVSFNTQTEGKNLKVGLTAGKIWMKVKRLVTSDSTVEVRTSNAVAGVRGTVYRVNVDEDQSATVKVYDGSVYVANPPGDTSKSADKSLAPHEVSGPQAVPPPYHEVTMEQWTAIVKAMQQIRISPQGVPSKPEDFDPKADADEWVRWNQSRDKSVAF